MKKRATATDRAAERLERDILAGRYAGDGGRFPSERDLAASLRLSRMTVRAALDRLERRGLIERRQGAGTVARAPGGPETRPVALLLREPHKTSSHYINELVRGAGAQLESAGSSLMITSARPGTWDAAYVARLGGVLVIPTLVEPAEIEALQEARLPHVVVGDSDLPGPAVRMDVAAAAAELTRALLRRGHRRFAMISGHGEHGDGLRRDAMLAALLAAGAGDDVPDVQTNYDPARAQRAAEELLSLSPRPTAVLAFDDDLAMHAVAAAQRRGLRVPTDVSVVGFNDAPFAEMMSPPLTTVRLPIVEAGAAAAKLIASLARGGRARSVNLGHEIVWRGSHGDAPVARNPRSPGSRSRG